MRNQVFSHRLGFRFGFAEKRRATCGRAKTKTIKPKSLYTYVIKGYTVQAHTQAHTYVRAHARKGKFDRTPVFSFPVVGGWSA